MRANSRPSVIAEHAQRGIAGARAGRHVQRDPHLAEHLLHTLADVVRDDRLDAVLLEELRHARVVLSLGPSVVEASPADVELLPALDPARPHVGDSDPVGASPARAEKAIRRDREAHDHLTEDRVVRY